MERFTTLTGAVYPLGRDNVDTDIIIPAHWLKTIGRAGLGAGAFETIRAEPGNVFDDPAYKGAPILIAGANYGGSSREHAAWAMADLGIRAVIAESFADIHAGNALPNGILPVALPKEAVQQLLDRARRGLPITVDLEAQTADIAAYERTRISDDPA